MYLILFIVGIIIFWTLPKSFSNEKEKWFINVNSYTTDPTAIFGLRLVQMIVSLIIFIIIMCNLDTMITGIVNLEYGAIKNIISFIK